MVFLISVQGIGQTVSDAYDRASKASHLRMKNELAELNRRMNGQNHYLGDADVIRGRKMLSQLPFTVPSGVRARVLSELGWAELRYGLEEEAIENLDLSTRMFRLTREGAESEYLKTTVGTLGLSYLRLAESRNCCAKPSPESCIFPLRGRAIHDDTTGSEKALKIFSSMALDPSFKEGARDEAAWLANIALMTLGRNLDELPAAIRLPELVTESEPEGMPEFLNIAPRAGVDTFGLSGGAVMDDFDGDGFFDLLVSEWDAGKSAKFFKNLGDGTFRDLSSAAGLEHSLGGLNMKQVDFDNDGDLDAYILRGAWLDKSGHHPNSLLRNDGVDPESGAVKFVDVTFAVGLGESHYPTQTCSWADFDLDGDLDLFVGNETFGGVRAPCQLFRNDGPDQEGVHRFTDIAKSAGVETFGYVKGVIWGDYDNDRYPDLYLSCINEPNFMYRNRGDGAFENVTDKLNVSKPERSFPAWFWDYNNDGLLDIFVSSYDGIPAELFHFYRGMKIPLERQARLYRNDGRGGFQNLADSVGLNMPMLPMGSNFGDLMNDGFPDIYLGTGKPSYATIVPNILIANEKGRFTDRTRSSRMGHLQKGHAVSFGDFDRDGDLDVFEQMGGGYRGDPYYDSLYENPGNPENRWLSVRLKGIESNSFGVGSRVKVTSTIKGEKESFFQWMDSGGSFGANPLELHFGIPGQSNEPLTVEVFWPKTGKTQVMTDVAANRRIKISEE
ncbi:MAG: CRTAC1 family protein [Verrucomicrobiales bacterium]|nr:CRTAC1 family protein [Verrucomicrobiales bacterium]